VRPRGATVGNRKRVLLVLHILRLPATTGSSRSTPPKRVALEDAYTMIRSLRDVGRDGINSLHGPEPALR